MFCLYGVTIFETKRYKKKRVNCFIVNNTYEHYWYLLHLKLAIIGDIRDICLHGQGKLFSMQSLRGLADTRNRCQPIFQFV